MNEVTKAFGEYRVGFSAGLRHGLSVISHESTWAQLGLDHGRAVRRAAINLGFELGTTTRAAVKPLLG